MVFDFMLYSSIIRSYNLKYTKKNYVNFIQKNNNKILNIIYIMYVICY